MRQEELRMDIRNRVEQVVFLQACQQALEMLVRLQPLQFNDTLEHVHENFNDLRMRHYEAAAGEGAWRSEVPTDVVQT